MWYIVSTLVSEWIEQDGICAHLHSLVRPKQFNFLFLSNKLSEFNAGGPVKMQTWC